MYPSWPIFVLHIHAMEDVRENKYSKRQEVRRNYIERALGVLKSRVKILRNEDYRWFKGDIVECSNTCLILDNFLIRINEAKCFIRDVEEEGVQLDVISKMYDEELALATEQREEQATRDY